MTLVWNDDLAGLWANYFDEAACGTAYFNSSEAWDGSAGYYSSRTEAARSALVGYFDTHGIQLYRFTESEQADLLTRLVEIGAAQNPGHRADEVRKHYEHIAWWERHYRWRIVVSGTTAEPDAVHEANIRAALDSVSTTIEQVYLTPRPWVDIEARTELMSQRDAQRVIDQMTAALLSAHLLEPGTIDTRASADRMPR